MTSRNLPPHPKAADKPWGSWQTLWGLRRDVLSLLPKSSYSGQVMDFRILGRAFAILNAPTEVKGAFVARHDLCQQKSVFMRTALKPLVGNSLFIGHGDVWAARRAAIAPMLIGTHLTGHVPHIHRAAAELIDAWSGDDGTRPRKVSSDLSVFTARVMTLILFGSSVPAETSVQSARDIEVYENSVQVVGLADILGWRRRASVRGQAGQAGARLRSTVKRLIDEGHVDGLIGDLAAAEGDDGQPLLDQAGLLDEAMMLLLAGSETSANALGWTLYLIATHPDTQATVLEEIGLNPVEPGDLTVERTADFPVLRSVIREALRLYPPVPILSRQPLGDFQVRHLGIGPMTTLLCMPWLMHRNPDLWSDPHAFCPARFQEGGREARVPNSFIPFGIGPRGCAGSQFAMVEMIVLLATALSRFSITPDPAKVPVPRARLTLRSRNGIWLRVSPRPRTFR